MPAGRAGRGSGRRHRGAGPGRHVRGRGALRMRAARPGCRPSSDGARRRCCASASPTFTPSRPACQSWEYQAQSKAAGELAVLYRWTIDQGGTQRSIVCPQPCSRRRRAMVCGSGWSRRCTSGCGCSPYRKTPPCSTLGVEAAGDAASVPAGLILHPINHAARLLDRQRVAPLELRHRLL